MISILNVAITGVNAAYAAASELYDAMRTDGNTDKEATHFANLLLKEILSGGVPLTGRAAEDFKHYWCLNDEEPEPTEEECYEAERHMAKRLGEDGPYSNC